MSGVHGGSAIQVTRMAEFEDDLKRGNQSGASNSRTITEINATINSKAGVDQVSLRARKVPISPSSVHQLVVYVNSQLLLWW